MRVSRLILWIALFSSCGKSNEDRRFEQLDHQTRTKLRQYINEGERLYNLHCANCHQPEGDGLAKLYPPLKNSDYLINDIGRAICIIKNGQEGEIVVNGVQYNQPMPANPRLTNLEIAEISTFLMTVMNDSIRLVRVDEVASYLTNCDTLNYQAQ